MTQDTRKDPRAKIVSLNVRYKSATVDEFIENHSHDVSKGGIFIKTSTPFPQGTLLKFEIRLSGDQAVIAGVGRVVWKREAGSASGDSPAGMGVKFIKIDEASRAVIDKLVGSREDAGSAFTSEIANEKPDVGKGTLLGTGTPAPSATAPRPTGAVAPPVKSTLIGMAAVTVPKTGPSSPTPAAGSPPAAKPAAAAGEGVKTAIGGFFPVTNSEADMPAPQERTMMKQAAELLEEALKGAGGSMDEVGTNPLFAGPAGAAADAAAAKADAEAAKPVEKASADIGVARPAAEPVPVTRRESPAAKESDRPVATSDRPAASSEPPPAKSDRPPAKSERPRAVRASEVEPTPQRKGGSGALLWVAVLLLIGGGLVYAYKGGWLGGEKPVTTTPTAEPSSPPSATETASAPSVTQSAAVVAPVLADASTLATADAGAAKKDAAAASTVGTTTAATATTATTTTSTAATTTAPKPPVPKPPVPKPTETATTAPTTTSTETAAPTAKPPKPKPTATEGSDNPY
ncbi:MAG: hypothetical protein JWM74_4558 [Myxococcaceae bacterium]|jgi:uncharacterized protein (TIGR02266 family)|nr:hypothetical protein [Myxococcaceae bacterium]